MGEGIARMSDATDPTTVALLKWGLGGLGTASLAGFGAMWRALRSTQKRADLRAEKAHRDEIDRVTAQLAEETRERFEHQKACEERVARLEEAARHHTQERLEDAREHAAALHEQADMVRELTRQYQSTTEAVRALHRDHTESQKMLVELLAEMRRR
jgi:hypothetical protein